MWEWRHKRKAVKKQSCSVGQGAGSSLGDVHSNLIQNFCRTWAPSKWRMVISGWAQVCGPQASWNQKADDRFLEHRLLFPQQSEGSHKPYSPPPGNFAFKNSPLKPITETGFLSVSHPFSLLSPAVNLLVAHSCLTLYDPMDCLTQGLPVPHHLPEVSQVHGHWILDAIQPSHPLLPSSPSAFNLPQHQSLFQWIGSMIQWMLAIWSLVPLPFLNPACTSGNSWFKHCRSHAWKILSITLLSWEISAIVW